MEKIALLIIDMQLGNFIGSNPIMNGKKLLSVVSSLILKARSSSKILIVFIQNIGGEGDPDEQGTAGWEIHPSIKPHLNDILVQKSTPDAFHYTNLHQELQSNGITKLVITGLQTEYCIDTTCRRAFSLGYNVILVADGHSTWDSAAFTANQIITHHNTVLSGFFVKLQNEKEILFN
jgi:nicotinamidase-related amidase